MATKPPLQILVTDDEESIRTLIKRCLDEPRFHITEAADGEEALKCAGDASGLALLITDEIMPGIHGHELARQLRARNADLKVLYLTGYSDKLFDAKQNLFDGEAFLDKPFTPLGLREAVALLMVDRLSF